MANTVILNLKNNQKENVHQNGLSKVIMTKTKPMTKWITEATPIKVTNPNFVMIDDNVCILQVATMRKNATIQLSKKQSISTTKISNHPIIHFLPLLYFSLLLSLQQFFHQLQSSLVLYALDWLALGNVIMYLLYLCGHVGFRWTPLTSIEILWCLYLFSLKNCHPQWELVESVPPSFTCFNNPEMCV